MHTWLSDIRRLFGAKVRPLDYFDFVIEIGPPPGQGRNYRVSIASSPAGQGQGEFRNPFEGEEGWLGLSARKIGERLFSEIFRHERVRRLYHQSVGMAQGAGKGLRLRLSFDMSDPSRRERVMRVANLPWELLYDGRFLALDVQTPVLRHLLPVRPTEGGKPAPYRGLVLLVLAEPRDRARLDLRDECDRIAAVCRGSRLELEILEHATVAAVRESLQRRRKRPTVLHFMGHGELGEDGALVFETADGLADPVGGEDLARLLTGAPGLRLAFLNACHSGESPVAGDGTGVATALVRKGLPAVLAMRSRIHDQAAILFSERFYASLAEGSPLEMATIEGRLAVLANSFVREEWQVPVLYQQAGPEPPVLIDPRRRRPDVLRPVAATAAAAALVLTGAMLWRLRPDPPVDESPSVDIACPDSGFVQTVDQVHGLGRDPTRSYYLFIQDQNSTCWLQEPIPLPLDANGKWSTRVSFSGPPGAPFTIFAVSSRQPLHPARFSLPGRYDCSVMLRKTEREGCAVEVAPATD